LIFFLKGSSALHYACAAGNKDVVSFIIEVCQVPLNQANDLDEKPLHLAARHGKHDVVALLIERYGCDVNTYTTKKMGTPYDLAKSNGHKKLSEYLKTMGGVTGKKMEKKREEEQSHKVPRHLESALTKNGFFMGVF
jgi:ankyrin repeat protein